MSLRVFFFLFLFLRLLCSQLYHTCFVFPCPCQGGCVSSLVSRSLEPAGLPCQSVSVSTGEDVRLRQACCCRASLRSANADDCQFRLMCAGLQTHTLKGRETRLVFSVPEMSRQHPGLAMPYSKCPVCLYEIRAF